MLYFIFFTYLGEVNKNSETMGKQLAVKLNLPLKGMIEQDLDLNYHIQYIFSFNHKEFGNYIRKT